jgi:hypothetical protein
MVWALVVAVVVAIGLPLAAWWFSCGPTPPPQPLGSPGSRLDPVDRWLFGHYQLGAVVRGQVKTAVFTTGLLPAEPALRQAAQGLAAEVASGNLRGPRCYRWAGRALVAEGACPGVVLVVIAVVKSAYGLAGLPVGLYQVALGALTVREARRQVQRARRLDRHGQGWG